MKRPTSVSAVVNDRDRVTTAEAELGRFKTGYLKRPTSVSAETELGRFK